MKKNTLVILTLFIILNLITDYTYANNPYFEEAKILFDQKNIKKQNFILKKILYLILKTKILTYI